MTFYKLTESLDSCRKSYTTSKERSEEIKAQVNQLQDKLSQSLANLELSVKTEDQLLALQTEINATLLDLKSQIIRLSQIATTEDFLSLQQTVNNLFTLEGQTFQPSSISVARVADMLLISFAGVSQELINDTVEKSVKESGWCLVASGDGCYRALRGTNKLKTPTEFALLNYLRDVSSRNTLELVLGSDVQ